MLPLSNFVSLVKAAGTPPVASFTWSMNRRFPSLYNYSLCYLNPESYLVSTNREACSDTKPWVVNFDASSSSGTGPSYSWQVPGGDCNSTSQRLISCRFPLQGDYTATLTVTGAGSPPATQMQKITVKDILIVSLGDSYASGEGNPDTPMLVCNSIIVLSLNDLKACAQTQYAKVESCISNLDVGLDTEFVTQLLKCIPASLNVQSSPPSWQDGRCHRSAKAGPALAAKMIEDGNPHESVTFLSLACSGASIAEGLLGPYDGIDRNAGMAYNPPLVNGKLPPQVGEVARLLCPTNLDQNGKCPQTSRNIDALTIGAGGNDVQFGPIIAFCAVLPSCGSWPYWLCDPLFFGGCDPTKPGFEILVAWFAYQEAVGNSSHTSQIETILSLKDKFLHLSDPAGGLYKRLNDAIAQELDVSTVYATEYPDPTHGTPSIPDPNQSNPFYRAPGYCTLLPEIEQLKEAIISLVVSHFTSGLVSPLLTPILNKIITKVLGVLIPGFDGATPDESRWAFGHLVTPLNQAILDAAGRYDWVYVGGIARDTFSHGGCVDDHWFTSLTESLLQQGSSVKSGFSGTLHPNAKGQQVYANHLFDKITSPPPTFTVINANPRDAQRCLSSHGSTCVVDVRGENGWFIGSCDLSNNANCLSSNVRHSVTVTIAAQDADDGITTSPAPAVSIDGESITYALLLQKNHDLGAGALFDCTPRLSLLSTVPTVICNYSNPCGSTTLMGFRFLKRPLCAAFWVIRVTAEGAHHLGFAATGGGRSISFEYDLKLDLLDPTATEAIISGTLANEGWYRSTVTIDFKGSDSSSGSGQSEIDVSEHGLLFHTNSSATILTIASDNIHTISYQAVDLAGRQSPNQTVIVKIDATPPLVTGMVTARPNANNWHNQDATIHFHATDATSGVASVSDDSVLKEGANQFVTGTAVDHAGNSASTTFGPVNIDETAPLLSVTSGLADGATYGNAELQAGVSTNSATLRLTGASSDALSGLDFIKVAGLQVPVAFGVWSTSVPLVPGGNEVVVIAQDKAGNSARLTLQLTYAPPTFKTNTLFLYSLVTILTSAGVATLLIVSRLWKTRRSQTHLQHVPHSSAWTATDSTNKLDPHTVGISPVLSKGTSQPKILSFCLSVLLRVAISTALLVEGRLVPEKWR